MKNGNGNGNEANRSRFHFHSVFAGSSFSSSRTGSVREHARARKKAALRRNRLGCHFRRQHVIGAFIVDFACLSRRLVVEVDGAIHRDPDVAFADRKRREVLEGLGFRVMRVSADSVERDLPAVLARIRQSLG